MEAGKNLFVPDIEFQFSFARSGGPGGQNVNKVSSKAILKWFINENSSLSHDVKERFARAYKNRINELGAVVIASDEYRDQPRNIENCKKKLSEMLATVEFPPKKRKPTKPTRSSQAKRVDSKRKASEKKSLRRRID